MSYGACAYCRKEMFSQPLGELNGLPGFCSYNCMNAWKADHPDFKEDAFKGSILEGVFSGRKKSSANSAADSAAKAAAEAAAREAEAAASAAAAERDRNAAMEIRRIEIPDSTKEIELQFDDLIDLLKSSKGEGDNANKAVVKKIKEAVKKYEQIATPEELEANKKLLKKMRKKAFWGSSLGGTCKILIFMAALILFLIILVATGATK